MILRDYQIRAIRETEKLLPERQVVLVAPTGSGKTVMGTEIVRQWAGPVLWLAHRRELVHQAAERLRASGLAVGYSMSGEIRTPDARVQVASVQTLARRAVPEVDLIVIDEAHHATAASYARPLAANPRAAVLGLTATPFRLDGRGLGDLFNEIVVAATPEQLVCDGTLVEPVVYVPGDPDLSKVAIRGGDFAMGQAASVLDRPKLVGDVVATWQKLAPGKRTIVFASGVRHSMHLRDAFLAAGVPAAHVDGGTHRIDRDRSIHRLRDGKIQVLCNCEIFTEGWDLPALEVAVIARPTTSLCLHLQMLGRIMRAAEGKAGAVVLDHVGNHLRLGTVTQDIAYSLEGRPQTRKRDQVAASVKRCPACFLLIRRGAGECPACGHVFTGREAPKQVAGELRKLVPFIEQQATWEQCVERAALLGYAPGWAVYEFERRMGFKPNTVDNRLIDPAKATQDDKRATFKRFLELAHHKGYKPGWAAYQYRRIYGVWPRKVAS